MKRVIRSNDNYSQEIRDAYSKLIDLANSGKKFEEGKQICRVAKMVLDGGYSTDIVDEYLAGCDWLYFPAILRGFVEEAGDDSALISKFGIDKAFEALDDLDKTNE